MKYTRFEITNFKGIRHLILDLDALPRGSIFTLVGLNESGKTTILEALDYLELGIDDSIPLDLLGLVRDDPNALIPIAERGNFNGSIEITVTVEFNDDDNEALKKFLRQHRFHIESPVNSFSVTDRYMFGDSNYKQRKGIWRFTPIGRKKGTRASRPLKQYPETWKAAVAFLRERMPSIWYFPNFLFDFPRRIYLTTTDNEGSKQRFYRNLLGEILRSVDDTATIERHISQRITSESASDKNSVETVVA